ncbi:hypothetical protein, partial [Pseudomonas gingeri]
KKTIEVAGTPPTLTATPLSGLQQRLRRPGDYLIQGATDDAKEIVHMDRNRVLIHTPLRRDVKGHYVNRWHFDNLRFATQEHLMTFIETHKQMRKID